MLTFMTYIDRIITAFSCKLQEKRANMIRKIVKELIDGSDEIGYSKNNKSKTSS